MKTSGRVWLIALTLIVSAGFASIGAAGAAEKREIIFYTVPPGSVTHSIATAMCDMLKKHSTWLTGTVEVAWGVDVLKLWTRDPSRKKNGVANMLPESITEAERLGILKDTRPTVLMKSMTNNEFWITSDPAIKTVADFAGKRIAIGKKGTGLAVGPEHYFKELGIYDKVKLSYLDFTGSVSAFNDRTVDAALASAVIGTKKGVPTPAYMEVSLSSKSFRCIGIDEKVAIAVREKTGYPLFSVNMPGGTMGKNQPDPLLTIAMETVWFIAPEFDQEAAAELLRVMWDNYPELGTYVKAAALLTKEDLPQTSFPASSYSPAAIKFFTEKKVKIGR